MTTRLIGALLCSGLLMFVTSTPGFAVEKKGQTTSQEPVSTSTTTVKSSKSNTSDRMGGGGGGKGAAGTAIVLPSGPLLTDTTTRTDRMGGGGGGKGAVQLNPQPEPPGRTK